MKVLTRILRSLPRPRHLRPAVTAGLVVPLLALLVAVASARPLPWFAWVTLPLVGLCAAAVVLYLGDDEEDE
jgi:hypothetical protein